MTPTVGLLFRHYQCVYSQNTRQKDTIFGCDGNVRVQGVSDVLSLSSLVFYWIKCKGGFGLNLQYFDNR